MSLGNAFVLTSHAWLRYRWLHFDVPIAPGRSVHIHVGDRLLQPVVTRDVRPALPRALKPLRVALRYRTGPAWQGRQLLAFYLPAWPLLPLTLASIGLLALATLLPERLLVRRW